MLALVANAVKIVVEKFASSFIASSDLLQRVQIRHGSAYKTGKSAIDLTLGVDVVQRCDQPLVVESRQIVRLREHNQTVGIDGRV